MSADGPLDHYRSNRDVCRRYLILSTMDGPSMADTCLDDPRRNPCDVCRPEGEMYLAVRSYIDRPTRSELAAKGKRTKPAVDRNPTQRPHCNPIPMVAKPIEGKARSPPTPPPPDKGPESEDMYDADFSFTSSMMREVEGIENRAMGRMVSVRRREPVRQALTPSDPSG